VKENITLRDIAEATGFSKNTVSLGMRNSQRLPDKTIHKIQKTAEQLGYQPNLTARNLTTGKSGLIGVYASTLHDAVRTEIVNGLITGLRSARYSPVLGLGQGHKGSWHTSAWVKTLEKLNVEAMVVVREFITKIPVWLKDTPAIILGCQPHNTLECDYVALDRYEAAKLGIKYLTDHGHQNILICAKENSHFTIGCKKEIQHGSATFVLPEEGGSARCNNLEYLVNFVIDNRNKFTAIIFGDSPFAVEFLTEISKKGINIPEDIAVISYDYLPYAQHLTPPLTTIAQPIDMLVSEAVSLVLNRLENPGDQYVHKVLNHKIIPGKSV